MQPEYEFIKDDPEDLVFCVESEETKNCEGPLLFSFDGKTVLNFWQDFPQKCIRILSYKSLNYLGFYKDLIALHNQQVKLNQQKIK